MRDMFSHNPKLWLLVDVWRGQSAWGGSSISCPTPHQKGATTAGAAAVTAAAAAVTAVTPRWNGDGVYGGQRAGGSAESAAQLRMFRVRVSRDQRCSLFSLSAVHPETSLRGKKSLIFSPNFGTWTQKPPPVCGGWRTSFNLCNDYLKSISSALVKYWDCSYWSHCFSSPGGLSMCCGRWRKLALKTFWENVQRASWQKCFLTESLICYTILNVWYFRGMCFIRHCSYLTGCSY